MLKSSCDVSVLSEEEEGKRRNGLFFPLLTNSLLHFSILSFKPKKYNLVDSSLSQRKKKNLEPCEHGTGKTKSHPAEMTKIKTLGSFEFSGCENKQLGKGCRFVPLQNFKGNKHHQYGYLGTD